MTRILQIAPTYYPATRYGGPIRSVHGLSAALVRRGHDVHVFTTHVDGDGDLDVPLGRPVELDGVQVTYFPVPALRRLYWAPAMDRRLRQIIAGYDAVHLQSIYLWPTWAAARAAERAAVPYIISARGMLVDDLIRRKSRLVKTAWLTLIERRSLARAAGLHVTTDLEADEAASLAMKLPLTLPEVFCIPNGVSWPERHSPLSAGPFAQVPRPYALYLGRLNWKKGLDRLIRAWKSVPDLTLAIAGNDEENYLPTLRALAEAEGVTSRIRFLGAATDEHKWALYAAAEMFILPSYSENFGNVVVEAMAMSRPVIVTPEVGLAPFVRETGAGVVSDGDPAVLARTVCQLHADATARQAMGQRGAQAVAERLSWDAVAARMEAVYRRIGSGSGTLPAAAGVQPNRAGAAHSGSEAAL